MIYVWRVHSWLFHSTVYLHCLLVTLDIHFNIILSISSQNGWLNWNKHCTVRSVVSFSWTTVLKTAGLGVVLIGCIKLNQPHFFNFNDTTKIMSQLFEPLINFFCDDKCTFPEVIQFLFCLFELFLIVMVSLLVLFVELRVVVIVCLYLICLIHELVFNISQVVTRLSELL